jgi:hypothetical protein
MNVIEQALYGTETRSIDVTRLIRKSVDELGYLLVAPNMDDFFNCDPDTGVKKTLTITLNKGAVGKEVLQFTRKEGATQWIWHQVKLENPLPHHMTQSVITPVASRNRARLFFIHDTGNATEKGYPYEDGEWGRFALDLCSLKKKLLTLKFEDKKRNVVVAGQVIQKIIPHDHRRKNAFKKLQLQRRRLDDVHRAFTQLKSGEGPVDYKIAVYELVDVLFSIKTVLFAENDHEFMTITSDEFFETCMSRCIESCEDKNPDGTPFKFDQWISKYENRTFGWVVSEHGERYYQVIDFESEDENGKPVTTSVPYPPFFNAVRKMGHFFWLLLEGFVENAYYHPEV